VLEIKEIQMMVSYEQCDAEQGLDSQLIKQLEQMALE